MKEKVRHSSIICKPSIEPFLWNTTFTDINFSAEEKKKPNLKYTLVETLYCNKV